MTHRRWILLLALTVTGRLAEGQNLAPGHVDPWPVLRAAAKAMGADNLKMRHVFRDRLRRQGRPECDPGYRLAARGALGELLPNH